MMIRSVALCVALLACSPQPAQEPAPQTSGQGATPTSDLATIGSPRAGARVTSPMRIDGVAPANWYFENQFPVRLLDANGAVIAEAPAHPDVNWTANAEPKVFALELPFQVSTETAAILVLQEDMPGDGETPREVRIPVVLLPGG
jgi:hypothetical protein